MSITVNRFLTLALSEIRVARAGDVVDPDTMADALDLFNELLDEWNATDRKMFVVQFPTFTITPSKQPHTIGVTANSPDIIVDTVRPESIEAAHLIIENMVRVPIHLIDEDEWFRLSVPTVSTTIPRLLWYRPTWPNGEIYLYPVPTTAYSVQLKARVVLAQVALTDSLDLPPAYQAGLRLTFAVRFASHFGQTASEDTKRAQREAMRALTAVNDHSANISTRDAGMPGKGYNGTGFVGPVGQIL